MPSYHFSSQPRAVLTMQRIIIFLFCVLTSLLLLLLLFISPTILKFKRATDHSCLAHICPWNLAHSRNPHKSIFNSIFIHSVKISFSSFDPSTESNNPQLATKASGFLEIFIAAFTPKTTEKRAGGNCKLRQSLEAVRCLSNEILLSCTLKRRFRTRQSASSLLEHRICCSSLSTPMPPTPRGAVRPSGPGDRLLGRTVSSNCKAVSSRERGKSNSVITKGEGKSIRLYVMNFCFLK